MKFIGQKLLRHIDILITLVVMFSGAIWWLSAFSDKVQAATDVGAANTAAIVEQNKKIVLLGDNMSYLRGRFDEVFPNPRGHK